MADEEVSPPCEEKGPMAKNLLLGAALALLMSGVGFVVGRETAPKTTPAACRSCPSTPSAIDAAAVTRAIGELKAEQAQLGKRLQPAAEFLDMLKQRAPALRSARKRANQTAAVATLRNITSAQAQIQATGSVDVDQDGLGEYAGFEEMSGDAEGRMSALLRPPVLSMSFRNLNEHGEASRSGYLFRIYLPGASGQGIGEPDGGFGPDAGVDAQRAESVWCIYAWPKDPESAGARVLFTNQNGDILEAEDGRYVGAGNGPKADAAFVDPNDITGRVAVGAKGRDGNVWRVVR